MSGAAHIPVLLDEVVAALAPKSGGVYVDATFGAGGYAKAILSAAECTVYGFDRDPSAIDRARKWAGNFGSRLKLINRPFADMEEALQNEGVDAIDGVVFDLGVSSMQLDEAERGFSFQKEGALSMRMDGAKPDVSDIIEHADARELSAIFKSYGEEKRSAIIAKAIVKARGESPIRTTTALASIVERASPVIGKSRNHPATRVFQALRIFVNDELGQLVKGLAAAERMLRPAGRLVVVTFHSLEDRIVKRFLAGRSAKQPAVSRHAPPGEFAIPSFQVTGSKPVLPRELEIHSNPRARSAKLRAGIRLDADAHAVDAAGLGLPRTINLANFNEGLSI